MLKTVPSIKGTPNMLLGTKDTPVYLAQKQFQYQLSIKTRHRSANQNY